MIGFIDAFVVFLLITINYKNSQSIFSRTLLPRLPRTRSILVLVVRFSPLYFVLCLLIIPRHGPHGKHATCQECVYIGSLPSNGCPSVFGSVTSGKCLLSRCLSMVVCVTIFLCGLQCRSYLSFE
jgi:hypothetical protein